MAGPIQTQYCCAGLAMLPLEQAGSLRPHFARVLVHMAKEGMCQNLVLSAKPHRAGGSLASRNDKRAESISKDDIQLQSKSGK